MNTLCHCHLVKYHHIAFANILHIEPMKSIALFFMLVLSGSALAQDYKQFEKLSEELLKEHLQEQFGWYQKSFKAKKHLKRIDTSIIKGQVQHLFSNQMADMPGVLQLYEVRVKTMRRYVLVEDLAAPLGGYFDIYLLGEQWELLDHYSLSAIHTTPAYHFCLSPNTQVLLSTKSELYKSVFPHKALSLIEIGQNNLNLCFQEYTSFKNTVDSLADTCVERSHIRLLTSGHFLDSLFLKSTSWCSNKSTKLLPSGPYVWNGAKHQYTLAFNDFAFDTLLSIPSIELPILFDLDSDSIRTRHIPMLDSFATFLKGHPGVKVDVRVHCDTRWSELYSSQHDVNRALSICNFLIASGVRSNQVRATGMGDYDPIVTEQEIAEMETEKEKEKAQQLNRRVELLVLSR